MSSWPWWAWLGIWVVLVAAAVLVLFLLGRSLVRKAIALVRELGEASERLAAVSEQVQALAGAASGTSETAGLAEPAVFADPAELRRQRVLARRAAARGPARRRPAG